MRIWLLSLLLLASPVAALNEGLQCVPYARAISGVDIRGDAHSWWGQAEGRYERGSRPKVGAVMAFRPHGGMRLGHVAAVRKIIDSRTVLVSHANWSTINGGRGHIENDVRVVDASEAGDWSEVRVWFDATGNLGTTHWPLSGFIYPAKKRSDNDMRVAVAELTGGRGGTWTASVAPVRVAAIRSTVVQRGDTKTLSFSNGFLADIDKVAAKERKSVAVAAAAKPKLRKAENIEDLLAGL
jgi:surface antigen